MEYGYYLKKNVKFIDCEVIKWSEMIKDWEEGVEIFGVVLIGVFFFKLFISYLGVSFVLKIICVMLDVYSIYVIIEKYDMKESVLYDCGDIMMYVMDIKESYKWIVKIVGYVMKVNLNMILIVFGGDYLISFLSIIGFVNSKGKVGII